MAFILKKHYQEADHQFGYRYEVPVKYFSVLSIEFSSFYDMNQKSKNPLHFSNHARNAKYKEI
jgi:hypothetical protein